MNFLTIQPMLYTYKYCNSCPESILRSTVCKPCFPETSIGILHRMSYFWGKEKRKDLKCSDTSLTLQNVNCIRIVQLTKKKKKKR